jgi:hypothetical protein
MREITFITGCVMSKSFRNKNKYDYNSELNYLDKRIKGGGLVQETAIFLKHI